jgi:TM2 domain-containing membrane protein YozV
VQTAQTFQQAPAAQPAAAQPAPAAAQEKNPGIAAILAVFFTGSGQVYNGETGKGIGLLIAALIGYLIFIVPGIIVWAYGIYDAYTTAVKMNKGEIPFKQATAGTLIGYIVAWIIIVVLFFLIIAAFVYGMTGATRYY